MDGRGAWAQGAPCLRRREIAAPVRRVMEVHEMAGPQWAHSPHLASLLDLLHLGDDLSAEGGRKVGARWAQGGRKVGARWAQGEPQMTSREATKKAPRAGTISTLRHGVLCRSALGEAP